MRRKDLVMIRRPPKWANSREQQEERLERLITATTAATGVDYVQLISPIKGRIKSTAKGCFYVISKQLNIHPDLTSCMLHVSRVNVINVARHVGGYIDTGDETTLNVYNKIVSEYNKISLMRNEKIKPVFNYCDEHKKQQLKMFIESAFSLCPQIVAILTEHGVPVTEKVMKDMVRVRRSIEEGDEIQEIRYNPNKQDLTPKKHYVKVVFINVWQFDIEWNKIKGNRIKASGATTPHETKQVAEQIDQEREDILNEICNLFNGGQAEAGRDMLSQIITINENGEAAYKKDLDSYCHDMSSVYVTSMKALKALELQKELCERANELVKIMKPVSLDVRKIFEVNPVTDEVTPMPIDFDLYINNNKQ
jgi:hypothetical protein